MLAPPFESVDTTPGSSFRFLDRREPRFHYRLHRHGLWELNLFTRGAGTVWMGDHIGAFRSPAAFLVAPDLAHTWASDPVLRPSPHTCLVLQFPPELPAIFAHLPEWGELGRLLHLARCGVYVGGDAAVAAADCLAGFPAASNAARLAILLNVLAYMADGRPLALSTSQPPPSGGDRFNALCRYLHAELDLPHTLAGLGRRMRMHPQALARAFRRHTGHSVIGYLQRLRIARACELLHASDRSILECALESGFSNVAHFNRVFRRLQGTTPGAWRRAAVGNRT